MKDRYTKISKFLSLVLRHEPEKIGLKLDAEGWTSVSDLLCRLTVEGRSITLEELQTVVVMNDKQRFSFSDDRTLIRANQGHSVQVRLGYEPLSPPALLYHGTAERFLASIARQGLLKGQRHHVHLSEDTKVASEVGARYGRPVVLIVASEMMNQNGHAFFRSENGVWLTEHVPVGYIQFP